MSIVKDKMCIYFFLSSQSEFLMNYSTFFLSVQVMRKKARDIHNAFILRRFDYIIQAEKNIMGRCCLEVVK